MFASSDVREQRLVICSDCDRLFRPTWTCKECGCFMAIKTKLEGASCPIGKWGSHPVEEGK